MRCVIVDTGQTLDCWCGRQWPKLPPAGAPQDCFPMLAANLRETRQVLRELLDCYFINRGEGLLELMRKADRLVPSDNATPVNQEKS